MNNEKSIQQQREAQETKRPYKAPSIIYTGQLTTRAGSGPGGEPGDAGETIVDPADLFDN